MIILLASKKFEKSKTNYTGADYLFWSAIICSFLISHSHLSFSFVILICHSHFSFVKQISNHENIKQQL